MKSSHLNYKCDSNGSLSEIEDIASLLFVFLQKSKRFQTYKCFNVAKLGARLGMGPLNLLFERSRVANEVTLMNMEAFISPSS